MAAIATYVIILWSVCLSVCLVVTSVQFARAVECSEMVVGHCEWSLVCVVACR